MNVARKQESGKILPSALMAAVLMAVFLPLGARAAYLRDYPLRLVQPDGEVIRCFVTGDEFRHRAHTAEGFTILEDPASGYFVYAHRRDGRVGPSPFRVGRWSPGALGISPGLEPESAAPRPRPDAISRALPRFQPQPAQSPAPERLENLVVFLRFSDEAEYGDSIETYLDLFNRDQPGSNSVANYFREASYGRLSILSLFWPWPRSSGVLSYQDSHPRKYYQPYDPFSNPEGYRNEDELTAREHHLLSGAIHVADVRIPPGLYFDGNGDGYVDNVCFVVSGGPDAWGDLLWPHMWVLYSEEAWLNGRRVYAYNFQLQDVLKWAGAGVLCHEMFHTLGAPDLYHYSDDGRNPVGLWDVMADTLEPPQSMGAYMKYRYGGWIDAIPEITASGLYSLQSLASSVNNCYRIQSPVSASEFFVLEYRKKTGPFESSLLGEGLLVYRINTQSWGNADGPPDEVYVYRRGGTLDRDGFILEAPFSSGAGRTAINDSTDPASFLSDGRPGGLDISQVGPAGDTISFRVTIRPALTISAPSGVAWVREETRSIVWTRFGPQAGPVRIQLLRGGTWVRDIARAAPNTGRFSWRVPSGLAPGGRYRIRVETVDGECGDLSPYFTIR
jgi:M6 family metalloprotease-like protein